MLVTTPLAPEMDIDSLKPWIEVVASLSALIIALVTALWVYTTFVLERGLLPSAQFEIECEPLGIQGQRALLEIAVHIKNVGTSVLVVDDIGVNIRYLAKGDTPELSVEPGRYGRLNFPGSVKHDHPQAAPPADPGLGAGGSPDPPPPKRARGFRVACNTFVQPRVDQRYTFVSTVPAAATYVLIQSEFFYATQRTTAAQRAILRVSRGLGLVRFTLRRVAEPHTAERVYRLDDPAGGTS